MPAPEPKTDRYRAIVEAIARGVPLAQIARDHGISRQRVYQIKQLAVSRGQLLQ